jgi:hypothetical protein
MASNRQRAFSGDTVLSMSAVPSPSGPPTDVQQRFLLHRVQHTLHILDEGRSTATTKWTKCSWDLDAGKIVVGPLAALRRQDSTAVPCDECFPGRTLPDA